LLRLAAVGLLGAAVASAASCDAGDQHEQRTVGPAIRILGVSVGDGRPMPADGAIQIAFDRYLLPSSVNRQSIAILDGSNRPLPAELAPVVQYDPVARTVTLRPPRQPWLTEGQPYKLLLGIPEGDSDTGGVRAIDRAKLFEGQPRLFAFFVGPKAGQPIEPTVSFCRDVLPIFVAKCNVPTCHGSGTSAAASLVLDTSAGVSATAIGRVAQGSNTGGLAGTPVPPGRVFGVDMPLVDPGNPGNSWLLYKVEMARPPVVDAGAKSNIQCAGGGVAPQTPFAFSPLAREAQRSADEIERGILHDYVPGREMPFPLPSVGGYADQPLTFDEREIIRLWIQGLAPGAAVPECGGCGIVAGPAPAPADAGVGDASSNAGGPDAADASDQ